MLPEKDQRPGAEPEALEVSLARDIAIVTEAADSRCRCIRCRRVLTADRSVRLGIGPRCWELAFGVAA